MEFLIVFGAILVLDILALRFGADSRHGPERDPKSLGITR
jgi:hypothetical protein